jgi:hypothetical protein
LVEKARKQAFSELHLVAAMEGGRSVGLHRIGVEGFALQAQVYSRVAASVRAGSGKAVGSTHARPELGSWHRVVNHRLSRS